MSRSWQGSYRKTQFELVAKSLILLACDVLATDKSEVAREQFDFQRPIGFWVNRWIETLGFSYSSDSI